jgi:spermidine/putrescine-binding protein
VTGIGYNKSKVAGPVDSWAVMFDPRYAGKSVMLNDPRELLAAALRKDGRDPNTKDRASIEAAVAALRAQYRAGPPLYDSDGFADKLVAGDVALAQGTTGSSPRRSPSGRASWRSSSRGRGRRSGSTTWPSRRAPAGRTTRTS